MWNNSNIKKEREKRNLCSVQDIKTFSLSTETGKFELVNREFFNTKGWHMKSSRHQENNILNEKSFKYSHDFRECIETNIQNSETLDYFRYLFDSAGNQTDYFQYSMNNELLIHEKTVYNANNQDIEKYSTEEHGRSLYLAQKYHYNNENKLTRLEELGENGRIELAYEFQYDVKGRISKLYIDRLDEQLRLQTEFKYEESKNTQRILDANGHLQKLNFYDEDELLIRVQSFKSNILIADTKYEYKKHT